MRIARLALAAVLSAGPMLPGPVWAQSSGAGQGENQMGYRLLSADQASALPRNGGALGLDVRRGEVITDAGMTFEVLRLAGVRAGSPGAQAGFKPGDEIIAIDGMVFANLAAFAAYVGSLPPGQVTAVDYIPNGGGPQQAQRVGVTVGSGARGAGTTPTASPAPGAAAPGSGLSAGAKIAIGVGALALFHCYKVDCFARFHAKPTAQ